MDTRQLRAAIAVEDHGSFTAAAARLFLSQSTLSRQVAALERHLGAALFVRGARTATPTAAGRRFLLSARATLRSLEAARDAARKADQSAAGAPTAPQPGG